MDPRSLPFRRRLNLFAALMGERGASWIGGEGWQKVDNLLEPSPARTEPARIPAHVLEQGATAHAYVVPPDEEPPTL